jgi:hypothetical protein
VRRARAAIVLLLLTRRWLATLRALGPLQVAQLRWLLVSDGHWAGVLVPARGARGT